ncbi:unnamed protein product [Amoebophrya sp. A25]|nr:unnamed protein product [Amoebophrya sp. A25]|eukprot:GSA25T00014591001.1
MSESVTASTQALREGFASRHAGGAGASATNGTWVESDVDLVAERGLPADEVYEVPKFGTPANIPDVKAYLRMYRQSLDQPNDFWTHHSYSMLRWMQSWRRLCYEDLIKGDVRWFVDGKLNVCDNCVDRWAETHPDRTAIVWEGDEPDEIRRVSYAELLEKVCQLANLLKMQGVKKGDRVTIYMPMIPEAAMCMLACARIGAVHSVVFAGFSSVSLRDRILDARSSVVLTANNGIRGGKLIKLKDITDEALNFPACDFVSSVIVFDRKGDCNMVAGRDVAADQMLPQMRPYCPCEVMDSEDFLFMLYTSGSTGKPKGIAHSTAGYLLYAAMTLKYVFDYHEGDLHACVADVGWITGHSYIVYGPLCNGATTFMFESIPTYPNPGRYWDMVQRHKINQFYTAPTALRALMRYGTDPVTQYDRSSLRILGTVGEPINPEAWRWYFDVVGEKRCPIADTFWQTETGGHVVTPLPGCTPMKPGAATLPFFGIDPVVLDPKTGKEVHGTNVAGVLCMRRSWPGTLRTVYGDHDRMLNIYYRPFPGYYFTGDGCIRDRDWYYWITGRVDDVINVSGHRIGSAEIEHALVQNPEVAESAVVGFPHEVKGEGIFAYVLLKQGAPEPSAELCQSLKNSVRQHIGHFAAPDVVLCVPGLPKTRSGKIMRRILRKIAAQDTDNLGDVTTLADPGVVEEIKAVVASGQAS